MTLIMDGRKPARKIRNRLAGKITEFKRTQGWSPCLATVQVGDDPAARTYIHSQIKLCDELGIQARRYHLPPGISIREVEHLLCELSNDSDVDSIILQRPLPEGWQLSRLLDAIAPEKDVEGIHRKNLGGLYLGDPSIPVPCTALAIMALLQFYGFRNIKGWNASVLGVSPTVGKAVAMLLLQHKASVSLLHSQSEINETLKRSDLVVAGIGKPNAILGNLIKPGAVIMDVGINVLENGSIVGDVDRTSVTACAGAITPVPGGIGPMTVASLGHNVLACALRRRSQNTSDPELDPLFQWEGKAGPG